MPKIAHCDCRGSLNSLNDALAGENGDAWLDALIRFLRKENPWPAPAPSPRVCLVQTPAQAQSRRVSLGEMLDDAKKRCGVLHGTYDFYRQNPEKIPSEWKGKQVFFPETEFGLHGNRCVRCVCWDGSCWNWDVSWVSYEVGSGDFVAVPASVL
jgi:hypothetical protein